MGKRARDPKSRGSLGEARPRPLDLVALIYSGGNEASMGKLLGAWHYSTLSSVAHGLPDGMSQYVQIAAPGEHAHLVMTIEDVAGSLEPVLTVHEATVRRLAQFFRWPMSDDLQGELIAARLFVKRAAGHVR